MKKINCFCLSFKILVLFALCSAAVCSAQDVSFYSQFNFSPAMIDQPPEISGLPGFKYPDAARKNGVEGKVILDFTLGEDSKVRDIKVVQGLPSGVTEALTDAIGKLYFSPAKFQGKPVPMNVTIEFRISLVYREDDSNVKKAKITFLPVPLYPESRRAEKYKDKVAVRIIFFADGTLRIDGFNSVLPKEFDKPALEAARGIKFEPAIHKKSQKPVTQVMTVEFAFKP